MKQSNYLTLFIILIFSFIFALFIPKMFLSTSNTNQIENVPIISSNFPKPNNIYFNKQSIDFTPYTIINNNNNANPFTPTAN